MRYAIWIFDHGQTVFSTESLDAASDAEAIDLARSAIWRGVGAGYFIARGGEIIHEERFSASDAIEPDLLGKPPTGIKPR